MEKLLPILLGFLFLVFSISLHQFAKVKTWQSTLINGAVALSSGLAPFVIAWYLD
jgi:uncharacterized membrane protein